MNWYLHLKTLQCLVIKHSIQMMHLTFFSEAKKTPYVFCVHLKTAHSHRSFSNPWEEISLWCIRATKHDSTWARSYKNVAALLTPSISCILCEQNNIMDIFFALFWWFHQLPLSEARPPSGCEQLSRMLNPSFFPLVAVVKNRNRWTRVQNSGTSFRLYLWVEADVWDGGSLVVRLVPEGVGLVKVAPELWKTNRADYCCWTGLKWFRISENTPQIHNMYILMRPSFMMYPH